MDNTVENQALPMLRKAIRRILKPLVRIMLQNGMPFQLFMDDAKQVFVDVASEEFFLQGRKQSAARVAIVTGLSRKEISRIVNNPDFTAQDSAQPVNRAARVISAWVNDPEFLDKKSRPLELPLHDSSPSFTDLVRKSSGDMLVRAMLDELVHVGAVEVVDKQVRLINRSYIPVNSEPEKFRILGTHVEKLIETINHNLQPDQKEPFLQRIVYYDNLPEQALAQIRALSRKQGQQLIELLDKQIQKHDRDVNPDIEGEGQFTAGIGVYYFEKSSSRE